MVVDVNMKNKHALVSDGPLLPPFASQTTTQMNINAMEGHELREMMAYVPIQGTVLSNAALQPHRPSLPRHVSGDVMASLTSDISWDRLLPCSPRSPSAAA